MIKPLQRVIIANNQDGTQVTRLPSNEEMMNKINEIVHHVNKHVRPKYEIGVDMAKGNDITGFEPRKESRIY